MTAALYPKLYLYKRIVQAKLFIDHHYAEKIDLAGISDEAYFSKFHFIRLFKNIYGKTPHQYLTKVRMDAAMILLQQAVPVTETCFAVGFESPGSFTGLFRRYTGTTPVLYLLQRQRLQKQMQVKPLQFVPGCFTAQYDFTKKSNFEEVG
jgi:AraC-like DNA-binding protein